MSLNEIMEFDHVIEVNIDGTVNENVPGFYAPEIFVDTDDDGQILNEHEAEMIRYAESQGWTLLKGFTGQYGYAGPIMHPSEYVGGGLEEYILETPGLYVVTAVSTIDDDDDFAGWVIAYRETPPYVVSDSKGIKTGQQVPILRYFESEQAAAEFISTLPEHETGRYNLDGPEN